MPCINCCTPSVCPKGVIETRCIKYSGQPLSNLEVTTGMFMEDILVNIDAKIGTGGGGGSQTLQQTTDLGNTSSNWLIVTGTGGQSPSTEGLHLGQGNIQSRVSAGTFATLNLDGSNVNLTAHTGEVSLITDTQSIVLSSTPGVPGQADIPYGFIFNNATGTQVGVIGGSLANILTNSGSANIIVQSQSTGKNIISYTGTSNNLDVAGSGILNITTSSGSIIYNTFNQGRVTGVDAIASNEFTTLGQNSLQSVSDNNNITSNALLVSGQDKFVDAAFTAGLLFMKNNIYSAHGDGSFELLNIFTGDFNITAAGGMGSLQADNIVIYSDTETTIGSAASTPTRFIVTGSPLVLNRAKGADAVDPDDFVTKAQLDAAIAALTP